VSAGRVLALLYFVPAGTRPNGPAGAEENPSLEGLAVFGKGS